jgi:hypothetical protein
MSTAWWWRRLDEDGLMRTAWWGRLDEDGLMRTAWWGRLGDDGLMRTAWWGRLDEDGLVMTAWWGRLDEDGLMRTGLMRTAWWGRLGDENGLMMLVRWWIYTAVKSFYLILSNLMFRTINLSGRVWTSDNTVAKTRPDPSDNIFCPTRGLDRVGLSDMFETQPCGQPKFNSRDFLDDMNDECAFEALYS